MTLRKRPFPQALVEAEQTIEAWRQRLLQRLPARRDVARYTAASAAALYGAVVSKQMMPHAASALQLETRNILFGLQFILESLGTPDETDTFVHHRVAEPMPIHELTAVSDVLFDMGRYSQVRDAFLAYAWGFYECEARNGGFRFFDPPDWPGVRDMAQQDLTLEVGHELSMAVMTQVPEATGHVLDGLIEVPRDVPMGSGATSAMVIEAFTTLQRETAHEWLTGKVPVLEWSDLVSLLTRSSSIGSAEAKRVLDVLTLDPRDHALTLFHCPLIRLTRPSLAVIPIALLFSNPNASVPRLATRRGPGLDAFSNVIEEHLLRRLTSHFGGRQRVSVFARVPYASASDSGDIDFVVFEEATRSLLLAEVKGFIPPDTVDEVARANLAIEEGLGQVERVRKWVMSNSIGSISRALRLPVAFMPERVTYGLIANGFSGSEYLPIPNHVAVADAHYLLLPRFKRHSVFRALRSYQRRLTEAMDSVRRTADFHAIITEPVRIEIPGRVFPRT